VRQGVCTGGVGGRDRERGAPSECQGGGPQQEQTVHEYCVAGRAPSGSGFWEARGACCMCASSGSVGRMECCRVVHTRKVINWKPLLRPLFYLATNI